MNMSILNKYWYFSIGLSILFMSSCSDENQNTSSSPLVVEAYLHIDRPFKVTVSNLTSVIPADVDHLTVTVSNDQETVSLNSLGGGIYSSDDNILVKDEGGNYVLNFANDNKQVTALTAVPSKPANFQLSEFEIEIEPIDFGSGFPPQGGISGESIQLTWENPNKGYYFTYFENLEDDPELINNIQNIPGGAAPTRFFRSEPTQESSAEIRYNQFEYYGKYNVILFHVNADYAGLYKEQENSSSLNLTSPFTNVVNGLGIFTAIHSDTVGLNVKKPQ
jgi:hypothetical protein